MKNLTLIIGILMLFVLDVSGQKRKAVEVTCPTYSNATIVTYRWKKGTPRNCVKGKAKEEFLFFKRRGGRKINSLVKMQAPKGKRFANDRKKTQKRILKVGMFAGKPRENRPYHWNGQKN